MNAVLSAILDAVENYRHCYGQKPRAILMGSWTESELRRLALTELHVTTEPVTDNEPPKIAPHGNSVSGIPIISIGGWSAGFILV